MLEDAGVRKSRPLGPQRSRQFGRQMMALAKSCARGLTR